MPIRMTLFVPAILAIVVAAVAVTSRSSRAERATVDCIAKPNSLAPQGSHWYYRLDRTANRRCWFLSPAGMKVREAASPKRRPSASSRPAPKVPAKVAGGDGESDRVAVSSMQWPSPAKSGGSTDPEPALMDNSSADEHATLASQDEMPLIWPVLTTADLLAAEPPPEFAGEDEHTIAFIAGVLALAIIAVAKTCKVFAVRRVRLRRRHLRDQWVATTNSRKHVPPGLVRGEVTPLRENRSRRRTGTGAPGVELRSRQGLPFWPQGPRPGNSLVPREVAIGIPGRRSTAAVPRAFVPRRHREAKLRRSSASLD
jgi:hypothetical protein